MTSLQLALEGSARASLLPIFPQAMDVLVSAQAAGIRKRGDDDSRRRRADGADSPIGTAAANTTAVEVATTVEVEVTLIFNTLWDAQAALRTIRTSSLAAQSSWFSATGLVVTKSYPAHVTLAEPAQGQLWSDAIRGTKALFTWMNLLFVSAALALTAALVYQRCLKKRTCAGPPTHDQQPGGASLLTPS